MGHYLKAIAAINAALLASAFALGSAASMPVQAAPPRAAPTFTAGPINVFTDLSSFDSATGSLFNANFENLSVDGSSGCRPSNHSPALPVVALR